jgi:predicted RecB family nuclease
MLKFTTQDIHRRYAPSECDRRIYLRELGIEGLPPSEFEQVLMRLGQRYEAQHLATFPKAVDLRSLDRDKRFRQTIALVKADCDALYQPLLKAETTLDGVVCEMVGEPDFLLREGPRYFIRDVKMARRVEEDNHPEILLQLQFYGWLFEQVFGFPPVRLEALNGKGEIVVVPFANEAVLHEIRDLIRLKQLAQEPYEPVGWTKCNACEFRGHCWPSAEAAKDVALVYDVDQSLATELHRQGVPSIPDLIERYDEGSLGELKRPWGSRLQKVGKKAGMILRRAKVLLDKTEVVLQSPRIPHFDHYVMFDLEGMPPHLDELDNIYLWGMQVFGKTQGEFMPAVANSGDNGDREGWSQFLANAEKVFRLFGDIPFVHWHHYERTHLDAYVQRYGDPAGIAARVRSNLLDLLPITRESVLLPLCSYSLKEVEKYVAFKRSQTEYGGSWSMAKYIEATETRDNALRKKLIDEILVYNREDLAATWAVFDWLRRKTVSFPRLQVL